MALNFLLKRSGTASKRPDAASMALGEVDINYDSATGGLFYKDSAGGVVKVGPAQVGSTAPNSTPAGSSGNSAGEFWYDTGTSALKVWTGSAWVATGGGGGSGTVTSITAGTGLTGGTITTSGTIALDTSGVSANSYTYASITVDTYGRVTAASNGTAPLPLSGGTMTGSITFDAGQTIPVSGIADATTSTKGLVQVGTNISVTGGVISVASASTSTPGVVELNDSTTSTSTTQALTANQGKNLQDQIDALAVTTNITLGGTLNANTGFVSSVTTEGTTAGLVVGNVLPAPATANEEIFVIVDTQGTNGPNSPTVCHVGDWFLSDGTTWQFLNVGFTPGQATTTSQGVVQLATDAEVQAGTDTNNAVVSSSLQSKMSDSTSTTSSTAIASSTAVKSAYDLANAALPKSGGTMTGDIVFNSGQTFSGTVSNLDFQAKGDLVAGYGANSFGIQTVGTNGQVLSANSACASGLEWVAGGGGSGTVTSITAGTGLSGGTITTSGTISLDTACVLEPADFTVAGQLLVGTGSATFTALSVGTDTQVLTADSTCTGGLKWAAAASGGVTQIIAGTNVTINPVGGTGAVTINASGGGGGGSAATPSALGTVLGWNQNACLSTAYGDCALKNRNSVCNLAVGYQVMCNTTATSCNNTAVGQNSSLNLNGCNNVLVGNFTGGGASIVAAMAGSGNTAVGGYAMGCAFNVNSSVAIGNSAGFFMCGDNNVAVGTNALRGNTALGATGAQNTGVGHNALCRYTTGACNTSLGYQTLSGLSTGSCNTALGHGALGNVTTGLNNLAIGIFSGTTTGVVSGLVNLTTECNNIVLGNFNHTCAQIKVAWTVTSDERDKAIDPAGVPYGLAFVNQIEPIAYCWCDRATGKVTEDRKRFGFSAQNIGALETSTPNPVIVSADDPENLRFTDQMLLPVLVNAIKELSAKNDALEARIAQLENQ